MKGETRGYKCDLCNGTMVAHMGDPRIDYIGKNNRVLKICRGCFEKIDEVKSK